MAFEGLTEYERKRLENIKRNDELLASLNIHSKLADLSASTKRSKLADLSASTKRQAGKRRRGRPPKSHKLSPEKKAKSETPIGIRRSLRTQGKHPESEGLKEGFSEAPKRQTALNVQNLGPISMRDVNTCSEPDEVLVKKILNACKESRWQCGDIDEGCAKTSVGCRVRASIDLESMELVPENIARVVPGRIFAVKFFPSADTRMVVAGNRFGDVGFWNVDSEDEDGDGIYLYRPHQNPVSGILIQPFSMNKIITSCHGGLIRSLDVEREIFDLAYSSGYAIFSVSQRPDDAKSLYFGEGKGILRVWDERCGSSTLSWDLHDSRINTIEFHPENTNMMATSSSDGTACIWDLRKAGKSKPESIKLITHQRAVHSAYFSPSGSLLATTSSDDKIRVLSGVNYDDEVMIKHKNQTSTWPCSFKGVWGWDDSYIFVGNVKRGVDVICTDQKKLVTTLESPHMSAVPCVFDPHPLKAGMLAGATLGGHVYIWSS